MEPEKKYPHHRHINLLLIITILLIVVVIVLVKPALLGYKISSEFGAINKTAADMLKEVEILKSDLLITKTNLESCEKLKDEFSDSLSKEKETSFNCFQEKDKLKSDYEQKLKDSEFELQKIKSDYDEKNAMLDLERGQLTEERDEALNDYDELSEKSAYNICCKAKVDDKEIDSYVMVGNKIVCSVGEERKIDC